MNQHDEIQSAAIKLAPAVGGATLSTLTLNQWVAIATLIYVILQIGTLLPKYWRWAKYGIPPHSRSDDDVV